MRGRLTQGNQRHTRNTILQHRGETELYIHMGTNWKLNTGWTEKRRETEQRLKVKKQETQQGSN